MLRKTLCLFLSLICMMSPIFSFAQVESNETAQAIAQAEKDAKSDVNEIKWVLGGCLLLYGFTQRADRGVVPPKAERLIGKSPEYIDAYTKAYSEEVKNRRKKYANIGCFIGAPIYIVGTVVAVRACIGALNDVDSGCTIFPDLNFGCGIGR